MPHVFSRLGYQEGTQPGNQAKVQGPWAAGPRVKSHQESWHGQQVQLSPAAPQLGQTSINQFGSPANPPPFNSDRGICGREGDHDSGEVESSGCEMRRWAGGLLLCLAF